MDRFKYNLKKLEVLDNLLDLNSLSAKYDRFSRYYSAKGSRREDSIVFNGDISYRINTKQHITNLVILIIILLLAVFFIMSQNKIIKILIVLFIIVSIIGVLYEGIAYERYKRYKRQIYFDNMLDELFKVVREYEMVANQLYRYEIVIDDKVYPLNNFNEYFEYYYVYDACEKAKAIRIED